MNIGEYLSDSYATLAPEGDLDAHSSVHLDQKIRDLIDGGHVNIHVDMSRVEYISSAGLGVFISFLEEISSQKGKFVLTHLADNVFEVFSILGLDKLDNLVLSKGPLDLQKEFE